VGEGGGDAGAGQRNVGSAGQIDREIAAPGGASGLEAGATGERRRRRERRGAKIAIEPEGGGAAPEGDFAGDRDCAPLFAQVDFDAGAATRVIAVRLQA